jgi:excisionase family DNA binding protein
MQTAEDHATSPQPVLATVAEVARHLAVSRSKVYQLMESNQLPYVKLGRCRRVHWVDVHTLLTANRIGRSAS